MIIIDRYLLLLSDLLTRIIKHERYRGRNGNLKFLSLSEYPLGCLYAYSEARKNKNWQKPNQAITEKFSNERQCLETGQP